MLRNNHCISAMALIYSSHFLLGTTCSALVPVWVSICAVSQHCSLTRNRVSYRGLSLIKTHSLAL